MSLIIKGIDLPKESEDITLEINHKGEVRVYSTELKETDTDAEAIQIPTPHGRLIDKDELLSHLKKDPLFDLVERYGVSGVIESRPTILEAEE